jgi:hypothetical protein
MPRLQWADQLHRDPECGIAAPCWEISPPQLPRHRSEPAFDSFRNEAI